MQKPHLILVRLPQICSDAAGGGDEWFEKGWRVLDPSIWSRLPGDVLERVLELLPVASVCRFRAVCCRWRVLLLRPRVCRMLASCLVPLLCTFDGAGADFQGMPVFRLDLSFLPLGYRKYWHTRFRFREEQDAFASHGGLVCITDGKKTPYTAGMCVFNPVTKTWRELPAMAAIFPDRVPADWRWSLGLRTFSGGFEVSVLCRTENPAVATTAVFSSQSGAWRIEYDHSGLLISSHKVSLLVHQGMYHSPEWHYLLLQEQKTALLHRTVHGEAFGEPQHVAGGRIWDSSSTWDCVCVEPLSGSGEFYLVSMESGIRIWKLDQRTLCLQPVSTLPDSLCRRVFKPGLQFKFARVVHMDGALILVVAVRARFFASGPCICQHYLVFFVAERKWLYAAYRESCYPIVLGLIKPSLAALS